MRKSSARRVLTFVLSFLMVFSSFPVQALAEVVGESEAQRLSFASEPELEEIILADDGSSPDELLAGYAEQRLTEVLPEGVDLGFETVEAPRLMSSTSSLNATDRAVLAQLKDLVSQVAAGERTSTQFEIDPASIFSQTSWTAEQLGVSELFDDNGVTQEARDAFDTQVAINFTGILDAILADCPFELYWFDKIAGVGTGTCGWSVEYDSSIDDYVMRCNGPISFSLPVASAYATGTYSVDPSTGTRVSTAVANAQAIASGASGTPLEKLAYFKNAICDAVTYDTASAEDETTPYGDPWQLISVFDGDDSTNVVCEGYSKAFKYLCDLAQTNGVGCILVSGVMYGGTGAGDHMWNIVNMDDGHNYLVDVTNCDEGSIGSPDLLFLVPPASGGVNEGYAFDADGTTISYAYDDGTLGTFTSGDLTLSESPYAAPEIPEGGRYFFDDDGNTYLYFPISISCDEGLSARVFDEMGLLDDSHIGNSLILENGQVWTRPGYAVDIVVAPTTALVDIDSITFSSGGTTDVLTDPVFSNWTDAIIDGQERWCYERAYRIDDVQAPVVVTVKAIDLSGPLTFVDSNDIEHACYLITMPGDLSWSIVQDPGDVAGDTLTFTRYNRIFDNDEHYYASDTGFRFALWSYDDLRSIDSVRYSANGGEAVSLVALDGVTYYGQPVYEVPAGTSGPVSVTASLRDAYTIENGVLTPENVDDLAYHISFASEGEGISLISYGSLFAGDSDDARRAVQRDGDGTSGTGESDYYLWQGVTYRTRLYPEDGFAIDHVALNPEDAGTVELYPDGTVKVTLTAPAELVAYPTRANVLYSQSCLGALAFGNSDWDQAHQLSLEHYLYDSDVEQAVLAAFRDLDYHYDLFDSEPYLMQLRLLSDGTLINPEESGLGDANVTTTLVADIWWDEDAFDSDAITLFSYDPDTDQLTQLDATITHCFYYYVEGFGNAVGPHHRVVITTEGTLADLCAGNWLVIAPYDASKHAVDLSHDSWQLVSDEPQHLSLFSGLDLVAQDETYELSDDEQVSLSESARAAIEADGLFLGNDWNSMGVYSLSIVNNDDYQAIDLNASEYSGVANAPVTLTYTYYHAGDGIGQRSCYVFAYDSETGALTRLDSAADVSDEYVRASVNGAVGNLLSTKLVTFYTCDASSGDDESPTAFTDDGGVQHDCYKLTHEGCTGCRLVVEESTEAGTEHFVIWDEMTGEWWFDREQGVEFTVQTEPGYRFESVSYETGGVSQTVFTADGDGHVFSVPVSTGPVAGSVSMSATTTFDAFSIDDGVVTFDDETLPHAYLISFDMTDGDFTFNGPGEISDEGRTPFMVRNEESNATFGYDYYCWPDSDAKFYIPAGYEVEVTAPELNPADAGTVTWNSERPAGYTVRLNQPATLVLHSEPAPWTQVFATDGVVVSVPDSIAGNFEGWSLSVVPYDAPDNLAFPAEFGLVEPEYQGFTLVFTDDQGVEVTPEGVSQALAGSKLKIAIDVPDSWGADETSVITLWGPMVSEGATVFERCQPVGTEVSEDGVKVIVHLGVNVWQGDYYGQALDTIMLVRDVAGSSDPIDLSDAVISGYDDVVSWTGSAIEPDVTVTLDGVELTKDVDYTVSYSNNFNASDSTGGPAVITVTGIGNYTGTAQAGFHIDAADLLEADITLSGSRFAYTGSAIEPAVTVTWHGKTLVKGTDYTVEYGNNVNASSNSTQGYAEAIVRGTGNFKNMTTLTFTITAARVSAAIQHSSVTMDYVPGTDPIPQGLGLAFGGKALVEGTDYTVSYGDIEYADQPYRMASITGIGNYRGTGSMTVNITPYAAGAAEVTLGAIADQNYTGRPVKPKVAVLLNGTELSSQFYTCSYSNNVEPGTATVNITLQGLYSGAASTTFKILNERASGTWGTCQWEISVDGVLTVHPGTGESVYGSEDAPWSSFVGDITSVVFAEGVVAPESIDGLLSGIYGATSIDVSGLDTSAVTSMRSLFDGCFAVETLDVSGWNTANVTDMAKLFNGCSNLASLNVSDWNTSNVTNMEYLFSGCYSLASIGVSGWNTSAVTNMQHMFDWCIAASSFDLAGWDTSNVTNTDGMFRGCSKLEAIYVGEGWSTESVTSSDEMFIDCTHLLGGCDTPYDSAHVDAEYARVDAIGTPGYLTAVTTPPSKIDINNATVTGIDGPYVFAGDPDGIEPVPVVTYQGRTLVEGVDYEVAYLDNVYAGRTYGEGHSAFVVISGKGQFGEGDFSGFKYVEFFIEPAQASSATVAAIPEQTCTGSPITPEVTVTIGEMTLEEGYDYTVSYANNVEPGVATATITGTNTGNLNGTTTVEFVITEPLDNVLYGLVEVDGEEFESTYELRYANSNASAFEGVTFHVHNYYSDSSFDHDTVDPIIDACYEASGLSGLRSNDMIEHLWLEDANGNEIDVNSAGIGNVRVQMVTNIGGDNDPNRMAVVHYDRETGLATKLEIVSIEEEGPYTDPETGEQYSIFVITFEGTLADVMGDVALVCTNDHIDLGDDNGVVHPCYLLTLDAGEHAPIELPVGGAIDGESYDYVVDGISRVVYSMCGSEELLAFDSTRDIYFYVPLEMGYALDSVTYTVGSGEPVVLAPSGSTYTDWNGVDYDLYVIPAVEDVVTISTSAHKGYTVNDNGTVTFEEGTGLPSTAYKLSLDLSEGANVTVEDDYSTGAMRAAFVVENASGGTDYYLWPDMPTYVTPYPSNEYRLVGEPTFTPSGAAVTSTDEYGSFMVSLNAPATMGVEAMLVDYVNADEDANTGITVDVPEDIAEQYEELTLVVEPETEADAIETAKIVIAENVDDGFSPDELVMYDIHYEDASGEEVVAPTSESGDVMRVTLPIPEGWRANQVRVYFMWNVTWDDGVTETIPIDMGAVPTPDGRSVVFYTSHFSDYVMTRETPSGPVEIPSIDVEEVTTTLSLGKAPEFTGKISPEADYADLVQIVDERWVDVDNPTNVLSRSNGGGVAEEGHTYEYQMVVGLADGLTEDDAYFSDIVLFTLDGDTLDGCELPLATITVEDGLAYVTWGLKVTVVHDGIPMYRLYNRWTGEHLYTADAGERDGAVTAGWTYEGIGWYAPATGDPVYRLYNPWAPGGDHHYTMDRSEYDHLCTVGWIGEGLCWYSDPGHTVPVFREYNPWEFAHNHNYTADTSEHKMLIGVGWNDEGIGWYGV